MNNYVQIIVNKKKNVVIIKSSMFRRYWSEHDELYGNQYNYDEVPVYFILKFL